MPAGSARPPADGLVPTPPDTLAWAVEADARRDALPAVQAGLQAFLQAHAVAEPLRLRAALLAEEAFMNAVMHAVAGAADPRLRLSAWLPPGELVLQLEDRGEPIEPQATAAGNAPTDPAEGPLGGRGLRLMQRLAQQVERERLGDVNRLTLRLIRT